MIRTLVLVAVLSPAAVAEAKPVCFIGPMRTQVVVLQSAQIAGSGGVVVASGTKMPDWRFRVLNRRLRAHVVKIAPGLAVYHPPPLAGIDVVLENENQRVLVRTERALSVDAVIAAPRVRSVTAVAAVPSYRAVVTELQDKVPAHALVVIASRVSGDQLVPITWARVFPDQNDSIELWRTPGDCQQTIPDATEPRLGEKLVLQWVDDAGRLSEPSEPIVITAGSKGK